MKCAKNAAGFEEYRRRRADFCWLFDPEPEQEIVALGGRQQYQAVCLTYSQSRPRPDGLEARYAARKITIRRAGGSAVYEYTIIDDHTVLCPIRHRNGREYLIFNIDLYGYSVLDLGSGEAVHYIPETVLRGGEEFIWAEPLYCAANDLLAVSGCYWACPWSCEFYDFADPLQLPLPVYGDSFSLGEETGITFPDDVRAAGFTETGECVLRYDRGDGTMTKQSIDILALSRSRQHGRR